MQDSKQRFSNRVADYVKYRPHYPLVVADYLREQYALTVNDVIADIGSGTGILSQLLLAQGNTVIGVEPNREMREAAELLLADYPCFRSHDGSAEATVLPDASVDWVTAGQAFHWFDVPRARAEFARILKPNGWVMLVWNDRRTATTPFLRAYDQLLMTHTSEYAQATHKNHDEAEILSFFAPHTARLTVFENVQHFDFDGLKGRLLSSSYTPAPGHPLHQPLLDALRQIFDAHQCDGFVNFEYDTKVYVGKL
ncbi:MAG: class I SAM-dependent methyltransferase [Anaerolineae bacterium]|nr:class I SAM-dependent methyltransferase [Anaerolineae bacterium]